MEIARNRIAVQATLLAWLIVICGFACTKEIASAKQQVQPFSGLDKMLKQANGVKVDAIVDNKLATNVTKTLDDMAQNLRKMFIENRSLNIQVQDLISRVQNVTGINATHTVGTIPQQTTNFTSGNGLNGLLGGQMNLSDFMHRFGQ